MKPFLNFPQENEIKSLRSFSFIVNDSVTQVEITAYGVSARQTVGGRKAAERGFEGDCNGAPEKPEQGR